MSPYSAGMEEAQPPESRATEPRRHDLDALRAFAMGLGLVLHGVLSLVELPWPVQDEQKSRGLGAVFFFIHGFRMPVFFLLSGYFTVLLWQRRGLGRLLVNRLQRIVLPLGIGAFTILPLLGASVTVAWKLAAVGDEQAASDGSPWAAARDGDLARLRAIAASDPRALDLPDDQGISPLHWAATRRDGDACAVLLELGAPHQPRDPQGSTPLHYATFLGNPGATGVLLEAGADPELRNRDGTSPRDHARWEWGEERRGLTLFIAGLLRLDPGLEDLPERLDQVAVLLGEASTDGGADGGEPQGLGESAVGSLLSRLRELDLGHLWFLWFLTLFVAGAAPLLALARAMRLRAPPALLASPLALVLLVPATALTSWWMHDLGARGGFGPETSSHLAVDPRVLLHYTVFFGFGALVRAADPDTRALTRLWGLWLALALLLFLPALVAGLAAPELGTFGALLPALGESLFAWGMTLGLVGLFQQLASGERRSLRYLSDSAYWMYLMHLPLVCVLQGLVAPWPMPPMLKLMGIVGVAFALLLASYALLVRHTPVGWLLNGRRRG